MHTLLAIGPISRLDVRQFNMKSAYLHGVINEEVWVEQLEGFKISRKENFALQLKKALYSFTTSNLNWKCSNFDSAVFFKS